MDKQHLKNRLFFWTEAYKNITAMRNFDLKTPEGVKDYKALCETTEKEKEEICSILDQIKWVK